MSFTAVLERISKVDNPYPGLRPFEINESHLFYGREAQIKELVLRLARARFVAVLGVSGSGKSSLVRAGLIPALFKGGIPEIPKWRLIVTRPSGAPFTNLSTRIAESGLDPAPLRLTSQGLVQIARQLPHEESLLVVVDQFEELFRYKEQESVTVQGGASWQAAAAEAVEYIQVLLASRYSQRPVYIVLTMRSDYLGDCGEFRDLPETLNDCQYLVPRMTREQRRDAIQYPLGRVKISPTLVQRMLNDVGDEPNQLPILQHALMRTWGQWRKDDPQYKRGIELQDYLAIGGFADALNNHADELLRDPVAQAAVFWPPSKGQSLPTITETVFKRLTARGRSSRERRDPATLEELWQVCAAKTPEQRQQVTAVVNHFRRGEASFLTPREGDLGAKNYIDITHESLIRLWKTLSDDWVKSEERSARDFLRLFDRATEWKKRGGAPLSGLDLTDALEWDRLRNKTAAWAEHYAGDEGLKIVGNYIAQSEEEERRRERSRRNFWLAISSAIVMAGLLVTSFILFVQAKSAQRVALARQLAAQSGLVRTESPSGIESAALLATESMERNALLDTDYALRSSTVFVPHLIGSWPHDDPLTAIAFSTDGHFLATGSDDGTTRIFELKSQKEVLRLAHGNSIRSVAFSPDSNYLATASDDHTARLISLPGGQEMRLPHAGAVTAVAFSPNARFLATASEDNTLRVFDARTGKLMNRFIFQDSVNVVVFSPDGRYLAAGSDDRTARVYEAVSRGKELLNFPHRDAVTAVAFSPDGSYLATGSLDHTARVFDIDAAREISRLSHGDAVRAVAFSQAAAGKRYVATGSDDKTARVFDATSGREVSRITHSNSVTSVMFSPDGRYVATGAQDYTARVFEAVTGREVSRLAHGGTVAAVAFSPNGSYLATASADQTARLFESVGRRELLRLTYDDRISVFADHSYAVSPGTAKSADSPVGEDPNTKRLPLTKNQATALTSETQNRFSAARISRDGHYVAVGSLDGTARVFELENGREIARLPHGGAVSIVTFSSDGRFLATAGEQDQTVQVFEIDSAKEVSRLSLSSIVNAMAFSADARFLGTAGEDHRARIFEIASGKEISSVNFGDAVISIAFSPDGLHFAAASLDQTTGVFEATSGKQTSHSGPTGTVISLDFSSDGAYLAVGSSDRTARVFEVRTAREVSRLIHGGAVSVVSFSRDGRYVATGSVDHMVRVFEASNGIEVSRINLDWPVQAIVYSSDQKYLTAASGLLRGTSISVTHHSLRSADLIEDACMRVTRNLTIEEWKQYVGISVPYHKTCPNRP